MVAFIKLDGNEFAKWRETSVREYAADRVRAGNSDEEHSMESAEKEFNELLPDGPNTNGQYIYSVVEERDSQRVGVIWYGEPPGDRKDTIYIYDVRIDERFRGRGYGTATLRLVEERAKDLRKKRISLHVFAHNERARKLYEELGYKPTNITMAKGL